MKSIIRYFSNRPVTVNTILIGTILIAYLMWPQFKKEERPDFSFEWVRVSISYPGASAEIVEKTITKPIEDAIKSIADVDHVQSNSSYGLMSLTVNFNSGVDIKEKVDEVKEAIQITKLPDGAKDPVYRQFNSKIKGIIDVALYFDNIVNLNVEQREKLQEIARIFESRITSLKEISAVSKNGYLKPKIEIDLDKKKMQKLRISISEVENALKRNALMIPLGKLKNDEETIVALLGQEDDHVDLKRVVIRSELSGKTIKLADFAKLTHSFEDSNNISKVQGKEAITINIKKSPQTDIISAQKKVMIFIEEFRVLTDKLSVSMKVMNDESYDVRNRLKLIFSNGILGFILILISLAFFLNFKSGFWVAMGIPFSLCFTAICAHWLGYSINNMSLAAIIIVIGIVVDDAIIIAESIDKKQLTGVPLEHAVVDGTLQMVQPILASVLTTCIAFVPLYFFSGRYGQFVKLLPVIISLMLFASLLESIFLLPSHLNSHKQQKTKSKVINIRHRFVSFLEDMYKTSLRLILKLRFLVVVFFIGILYFSFHLAKNKMKFSMFPTAETTELSLKLIANDNLNKEQMAEKISDVEQILLEDKTGAVVAVRSTVGGSFRGGKSRENEAHIRVELTPSDERKISSQELTNLWKEKIDRLSGYKKVFFRKTWWGSDGAGPIGIEIQDNNDEIRNKVSVLLVEKMNQSGYFKDVELEKDQVSIEYELIMKHKQLERLAVDSRELGLKLKTLVANNLLYTKLYDEEVDIILNHGLGSATNIDRIMSESVVNQRGFKVPIAHLVTVHDLKKAKNIEHIDFRRYSKVNADIQGGQKTPLELARYLEKEVFPNIQSMYPSTLLVFKGEIKDSRESQSQFGNSLTIVLILILAILIFLYHSFITPLLIMVIIPFGVIGVIVGFWLHGMLVYGFYALIGTLGMIGVVVNDAIVMVTTLEENIFTKYSRSEIAEICATRLRPIILTTLTTVAGVFPSAYGLGGYDGMLVEMMMAMGWGLLFSTTITLILLPCLYSYLIQIRLLLKRVL